MNKQKFMETLTGQKLYPYQEDILKGRIEFGDMVLHKTVTLHRCQRTWQLRKEDKVITTLLHSEVKKLLKDLINSLV